jgi:hypothetical protein
MKYLTLLILLCTLLFSCKKESNEQCFKIKWIDGVCATNIYQIQDSAFTYLGEDNYVIARDGKTYDNVFTLANYCDNITSNADSTAIVKLNTSKINLSCIVCFAAYTKQPPKALAVSQCK